MTLNGSQLIFTLFFAIFWSTTASAWPRWKPFHWPLFFQSSRVRKRICLSFVLFNVFPPLSAAVTFWLLSESPITSSHASLALWIGMTLSGVLPAFSIFGFYRLWMGIVATNPTSYYYRRAELSIVGLPATSKEEEIEPSIETLNLDRSHSIAKLDMLFGFLYISLALLAAAVFV